jgi:hypothetical protein
MPLTLMNGMNRTQKECVGVTSNAQQARGGGGVHICCCCSLSNLYFSLSLLSQHTDDQGPDFDDLKIFKNDGKNPEK